MKQAVTKKVALIEFREVEMPSISHGQVLLKMKYVGICGSDIHIYHGQHPFVPPSLFPLVQGHEGVGEIVEVGSDVNEYDIGDLVVIEPQIFCGECPQCAKGDYHICKELKVIGCQCDGMFSEYFAVEQSKICKIPHTISPTHAAMIEPLAVAVRAVRRLNDVLGKNILVLGGGTIGNLVAQVAMAFGAHSVAIVDVLQERLSIAVDACGIAFGWNPHDNVDAYIAEAFGDAGADAIFECVGIEATIESAIQLSGKGKEIVVVGVFGKQTTISMALIQDKEIYMKGTLMYKHEDYVAAIDLVERNLIHLDALIYKVIPFDEYPDAYKLIDDNKANALKVLVQITK